MSRTFIFTLGWCVGASVGSLTTAFLSIVMALLAFALLKLTLQHWDDSPTASWLTSLAHRWPPMIAKEASTRGQTITLKAPVQTNDG